MAKFISNFLFDRWFLLLLLIITFANQSVSAQSIFEQLTQPLFNKKNLSNVTLSAPHSVNALLQEHFELPHEPLVDETSKRVFLRRAKREIGELLATEGYFSPTVTLTRKLPEDFEIVVQPGPRTLVSEVTIEFRGELTANTNTQQKRIQQLREAWPLKTGKPFRSHDWEEAKAKLLSDTKQNDYAAAEIIDSKAVVDRENKHAQLTVVVDSGPVFYFGKLIVTGLKRYQDTKIENFSPFKPGDPYRRELLFSFQESLQKVPNFSSVTVSINPDRSLHKAAPILVQLSEKKSKSIALGAGYSSNNGGRGEINFQNYNFLDRALNLSSTLRLEQKQQTFFAGIDTLPNQDHIHYSLGSRLQLTDIAGLETINQSTNFTRRYVTKTTQHQIGLSWQREKRIPSSGIRENNEALVIDWQWRKNKVDNPLNIRQGSISEIRIGGASQQVLSDQTFLRTYARQQFWWPVGNRDVLFLRGEAGYTLAESRFGIPQEYLFRAGGINSVRGYDFLSLGVHEGNAIVGGRTMASGTIEYTHWLLDKWGGAVFTDVGNATDSWKKFNPAVGYGVGLRWRSPVGPLTLDLARGQKTGLFRLHFSIAVAF
ncbi:Autotransporter secretion outer membrane protein TamA [Candidatus Nitrotoga sp. HW29]|uniref:autotransporter assembly complex protein TamA n=1 Tax=Candidatus Nitrotoga sp. HW29 TaxID=2886963 RepID=UPI001EF25B1E|nr:BamA/TamA family outer membrane protein [Candidatus Nitrotoga sp. HW29]CAH1903740.1 Autotransporter secretion outer membrane protein TamA [Candidatus Nitrotoga sp. HW29]